MDAMRNKTIIIISIIFFLLLGITGQVFATTAKEVKDKINDINAQIEELDREIAQYQSQITETEEQKKTLNNTIKELTLTRSKLLVEKNQIQKKINATDLVIEELGNNIQTKEETIRQSELSLEKGLYTLYQNEKNSFIELLLSKEKFKDFSEEYNNIISVNESVRNNINELLVQKDELNNTKVKKLDEQDQLKNLKKTLIAKETAVLNAKKEKDALLVETKNKEATYQALLAEQIKRRDAFEKSITEYEAQLQFILNPKLLPKEGSEPLSWPLDSILITSTYGSRWGSFHYGLDFRAAVGTSVKAMRSGVVEGVGDTDTDCPKASFGKWIFIKYDDGLSSTFGHLSVISVKKGDKVKAGDVVGLSGNTGSSTGPHLHVSVYASTGVNVDTVPSKSCNGKIFTQPIAALNAYLNPLLYLPKTTKSMYK